MVESVSSEAIWGRRILEGVYLWLARQGCRMGSREVSDQLVLFLEVSLGDLIGVSIQLVSWPV